MNVNITNPTGGQILVFNEITQKFVNVDLTKNLIQNFNNIDSVSNIGGASELSIGIQGSNLRLRTLQGDGNHLSVQQSGNTIIFTHDGDADTLGGLSKNQFLEKANNLNDVDPVAARNNLSVLSSQEANIAFFKTNASNAPLMDNRYDFGSNGRRFANIYAVNFHGNASSASNLKRNNANDGEVLTWSSLDNKWIPTEVRGRYLNNLLDVDTTNIQHESMLVYNAQLSRWETLRKSQLGFTSGGTGGSSGESSIVLESLGGGMEVLQGSIANQYNFRSLSAGSNITLDYNFNGEEIIIKAIVPTNTDALPQGTNNRYYSTSLFRNDLNAVSIQDMGKVSSTPPGIGQAPIWDGSRWNWVTVNAGINTTDDLVEGTENRYYTPQRVGNDIDLYLQNNPLELSDLENVEFSNIVSNRDILVFDSNDNKWVNSSYSIKELNDVDIDSIVDTQSVQWSNGKFVPLTVKTDLSEFNENSSSLHFNTTNMGDMLSDSFTTDNLPEGAVNKYLNVGGLTTLLGGMSASVFSDLDFNGLSNGSVLVWDGSSFVGGNPQNLNINISLDMEDLGNTSLSGKQDGDFIVWDNTSGTYIPKSLDYRLLGLDDVEVVSSLTELQTMVYNGVSFSNMNVAVLSNSSVYNNGELPVYNNGYFESKAIADIITIDSVGGINLSSPNNGDVIVYSNGELINQSLTMSSSILGSSDVSLSGFDVNLSGYVPVWDKDLEIFSLTRLGLVDLVDVEASGLTDGQSIVWSGNTNTFKPANFIEYSNVLSQEGVIPSYNGNGFDFLDITAILDPVIDISSNQTNGYILRYDGNKIVLSQEITTPDPYELPELTLKDYMNDVIIEEDTVSVDNILKYFKYDYRGIEDFGVIPNTNIVTSDGSSYTVTIELFGDVEYVYIYDVGDFNHFKPMTLKTDNSDLWEFHHISEVDLDPEDTTEYWANDVGLEISYDDITKTMTLYIPDTASLYDLIDIEGFGIINLTLYTIDINSDSSSEVNTMDFVEGNGAWITADNLLEDLKDVEINTASNGQVLLYNDVSEKWENGSLSFSLNDLNNTLIASPNNGQLLSYNGSEWVNKTIQLSDISDISNTSPTNGYALVYDTGEWKPHNIMGDVSTLLLGKSDTSHNHDSNEIDNESVVTGATVTEALDKLNENILYQQTKVIDSNYDFAVSGILDSAGKVLIYDDATTPIVFTIPNDTWKALLPSGSSYSVKVARKIGSGIISFEDESSNPIELGGNLGKIIEGGIIEIIIDSNGHVYISGSLET